MEDLRQQAITYLPGIGPQRAKMLEAELGIKTWRDLLYTFPYKHIDRSRLYKIKELTTEMPFVQVLGQFLSFEEAGQGRKHRLTGHFWDGEMFLDVTWFHGISYIKKSVKLRQDYILFGRPGVYGGRLSVIHPDLDKPETMTLSKMSMQPYYSTTDRMKKAGMTSRTLEKFTSTLFSKLTWPLPETLPQYLIERLHLMPLDKALRAAHYPSTADELAAANMRLKFEELFFIQLVIMSYARKRQQERVGQRFTRVGEAFNTFYHKYLPFPLTEAQKRVIREMHADMKSGRQMNRLLQGDVGSGKTLVALMVMLIAIDNGCQTCIMAPTEILAEQHLQTFLGFLKDMPVRVELLTGNVKGKKRKAIEEGLLDGSIDILIGTHAVIEDNVQFNNLGLVIIDEQHRFGVAQRAKLQERPSPNHSLAGRGADTTKDGHYSSLCKGEAGRGSEEGSGVGPHVLVMTATPIPRTLAMTVYGDLDVSIIDELPPGRKPVRTIHIYDNQPEQLYRGVVREIEAGHQVYFVFPLVKESEKLDLKNVQDEFVHLKEIFPQYRISMVHGKMKPSEKDVEMQRFVSGETQILVATTVIEVGVNVPNASVMVIQNAERFGLAQLHQLRGRVGRGAEQSYCILVSNYKLSAETRKRLQIMTETNDGFEIAEADLKLRGPGDLEGTQQSGIAFNLKLANLGRDGQLVQLARDTATFVLDADPDLLAKDNTLLRRHLQELKKEHRDWSQIS
ncbi:MAG: ATP-dependent DNA helicase RecG [Bacteroidaceae bacterium]|nr:ATP-dependent DNA helicase RecG [Bacteroidaceae bacterium]